MILRRTPATALEPASFTATSADYSNGSPSKSKVLSKPSTTRFRVALERWKYMPAIMAMGIGLLIMASRSLLAPYGSRDETASNFPSRIRQRSFPVMVQLSEGDHSLQMVSPALPKPVRGEKEWLVGDDWEDRDCLPMHQWQLQEYSPYSCNSMHEVDMHDVFFINDGGSRIAWKVQDIHGEEMVLKTPK